MTKSKNQAYFSVIPRGAIFDDRLKPIDRQVIMVLGLYQGFAKEAWPSQVTIAEHIDSTQPTISRSLKRLEQCGYIISRKKNQNAPGTAKAYQVRLQNPNSEYVGTDISEYAQADISEHVGADMSHKEETNRRNQKKNNVSFLKFEQAYKLYNSTDNKVNQVKATAKAAWQKAVKKTDPEIILSAIQAEVDARSNSEQWIPALPQMQRWLKEERWESIETTAKPETPENAPRKTGEQTANGQAIYELNGERFYFGDAGPIKIKEANHARSSRERDPAMGEVQTPRRAQANMSLL